MTADILNEIGQRIKNARQHLNIQQKDAAAALGVSPSNLSEIESGKKNSSTDFIFRLSELYNISVEYIFHGRGKMTYDPDLKLTEKEFDFTTEVMNLDYLIWLLKKSPYFKSAMMFQASKLLLTEEELIKNSMKKFNSK